MTFNCPYCPLTTVPHEHDKVEYIEESNIYITSCRHGVIPDYLCRSCLDYWALDYKIKQVNARLDNIGFVAKYVENGSTMAQSFDNVESLFGWLEEYVTLHGRYPDGLVMLREQVLFGAK